MSVDFTGVKSVTIPEGVVKKITRENDGATIWEKPVSTITFNLDIRIRIGGYQYMCECRAEAGMTWEQLCKSDYRFVYTTDGIQLELTLYDTGIPDPTIDGYVYVELGGSSHIMHTWDLNNYYSALVLSSDIIVADKTYYAAIGY